MTGERDGEVDGLLDFDGVQVGVEGHMVGSEDDGLVDGFKEGIESNGAIAHTIDQISYSNLTLPSLCRSYTPPRTPSSENPR